MRESWKIFWTGFRPYRWSALVWFFGAGLCIAFVDMGAVFGFYVGCFATGLSIALAPGGTATKDISQ